MVYDLHGQKSRCVLVDTCLSLRARQGVVSLIYVHRSGAQIAGAPWVAERIPSRDLLECVRTWLACDPPRLVTSSYFIVDGFRAGFTFCFILCKRYELFSVFLAKNSEGPDRDLGSSRAEQQPSRREGEMLIRFTKDEAALFAWDAHDERRALYTVRSNILRIYCYRDQFS